MTVRRRITRPVVLVAAAAASGAGAGVASFVFLEGLDRVTRARIEHPWLVWLLPVVGLSVGIAYVRVGGRANGGTGLVIAQANRYTDGTPGRMTPLVLGGTLLGHLVGASVGREGTAVQMSASLTDVGGRRLGLAVEDRAVLARAALAGGFGSVFGVPFTGVVFALEASRRRSPYTVVTAVIASFVGNAVVGLLGHHHATRVAASVPFGWTTLPRLVLMGLALGLVARLFVVARALVRRASMRVVPIPSLRPALGGIVTLAVVVVVGRDHLGLSLPLLDTAVSSASPEGLDAWDPLLKLVLTAVAIGSGFVGGEVTPLFVVGAMSAALLAGPLGLPPAALGAIGMSAVFSAAAHLPITGVVLAVEVFGGGAFIPAVLVCAAARATAHPRGLYDEPRPERPRRRVVSVVRGSARAARAGRGSAPRST